MVPLLFSFLTEGRAPALSGIVVLRLSFQLLASLRGLLFAPHLSLPSRPRFGSFGWSGGFSVRQPRTDLNVALPSLAGSFLSEGAAHDVLTMLDSSRSA